LLSLTDQGVLPPFIGDPASEGPSGFSPFLFTPEDFVAVFGTSPHRSRILTGFFEYRKALRRFGVSGTQWIGGSFVEDCKKIRGREPSDIDVVTFIDGATVPQPGHPLHEDFRTFISHSHRKVLKADYLCDAFIVSAMYLHPSGGLMNVYAATDVVRYWCNFFGHSRSIAGAAQVWKGMVEIPLSTDPVDAEAVRLLEKEGGGS